jgi:hypothetical protein
MYWFSPAVLSCVHPHPLDATIQYTTKRSFFVRWFDKNSDHRHDDTTISVTSVVSHEPRQQPDAQPSSHRHDDRRSTGIHLHKWIECILNGLWMHSNTILEQQFCSYHTTHINEKLVPWRTEMAIRSCPDIRLVGVVDALFMDGAPSPDEILVLHLKDWKYSKSISSCLEEYTHQLNLYKFILESYYTGIGFMVGNKLYNHIKIATMELVVFHETLSTYVIHSVPDTQQTVCRQMVTRKKSIQNSI